MFPLLLVVAVLLAVVVVLLVRVDRKLGELVDALPPGPAVKLKLTAGPITEQEPHDASH
jgi:hypothetical protein